MIQTANTAQQDQKNQVSAFRHWVHEIWLDNCDERLTHGGDPYTMKEYWNKYKFWLKKEYRHQHERR